MRRKHRAIAVGVLLLLLGFGAVAVPTETCAQDSCRATCWEAYGACYRSTSNRPRCQAQLQRCLDRCIRNKR